MTRLAICGKVSCNVQSSHAPSIGLGRAEVLTALAADLAVAISLEPQLGSQAVGVCSPAVTLVMAASSSLE